MSKIITMVPCVCNVCKQTWQVPKYIAEHKLANNLYSCPTCRKKEEREYARQYLGKMMP